MRSPIFYVAYGANMNREAFMKEHPNAKEVATGKILDHSMYFDRWAGIQDDEGETVPGILYVVSKTDLKHLDEQEGVPESYRRSDVTFEADKDLGGFGRPVRRGERFEAEAYHLVPRGDQNAPSGRYVADIVKSTKREGMDSRAVKEAIEGTKGYEFPLVVVDTEPTQAPNTPGWAQSIEIGAVFIDKDGNLAEVVHFGPGSGSDAAFSGWIRGKNSPKVTSYNRFDKKRLEDLGIIGLSWAPDILKKAIRVMDAAGKTKLLDAGEQKRKKWPTLGEISEFFGLPKEDGAHTVEADAKRAAEIVKKLAGK